MKVKFVVPFMDFQKDDTANLGKELANHYLKLGVCQSVRPAAKREQKAASTQRNKMVTKLTNK
jgi:hypothetical protein